MKFIVIDGLDGAGKDTQAQLIYEDYKNKGYNVVLRSHPSIDTNYGRKSKEALLKTGKINHLKATVFYGLDVISSVKKYFKKDDIDILIFSRYTLAVVYLPNIINLIIYKIVSIALPVSNYMFFLDVSPDESLKRLSTRDEAEEMFENKKALVKARNKSLNVIYNWNIIDANRDPLTINEEIKKLIKD
ncbi:thymidylate kinase [Methanobrevibacter sp. DSM 116169]|uniref:thymidylate kinase n=1 Tax=Methanobrevibacter sp. DSM 116169 TaxID=3242727 RepID=UPI0038FD3500